MKFKSSIFYTITFIFILAGVSISLAFLWLIDFDQQNYTKELNYRYSIVSRLYLYKMSGLISNEEFKSQMKPFKMKKIKDIALKNEILKDAKIIQTVSADIGSSSILVFNKAHFLKITHNNTIIVLKDMDFEPYRYLIFKIIWLIVFSIIVISYVFVIKKLKPLRKLKRQIDKFANGDLKIKNVSTGDDEISQVASAFYQAVTQINKLNESRQLFLRNMMHELKTPITKGRITTEMIGDGIYKQRLTSVFERLESLINEFAAIERATLGLNTSNLINCLVDDLINEALDLAMIDENKKKNFEIMPNNVEVRVDFKLFSVAIKNIIDNGRKYSDDEKVKILVTKDTLAFITKGKKLEKELKYYIEPFSKGKNAYQSFGLGLYIVENILKVHKLKLGYKFEDGNNIFYFENFKRVVIN